MTKLITRRNTLKLAGAMGAFAFTQRHALATAGTLERVKKEGVLRIGTDAGFPPFSFRDTTGKIVGYDLDLASQICLPIGVKPQLVDTQWSGIIPSLLTGHFDAIMEGISYTKARAAKVAFSIPYAEASQALLIRSSDKDKIKTVDDMSGLVIGIKLASPAESVIKKIDPRIQAARGKGFGSVKTYDDLSAAYIALAQGSVDAVMNSIATMTIAIRDKPGTFALVKGLGVDSWCAIAARKEDTDLIGYLNDQLMVLRKNRMIYELQEKWFQLKMPLPDKLPDLDI